MLAYPKKNTESQRYLVVKKQGNGFANSCLSLIALFSACLTIFLCLGVVIHMLSDQHLQRRKPECEDVAVVERKWRTAEDRANHLETELGDLRRKHRLLEDDFRDLAISSRNQQQQQVLVKQQIEPTQDVSTMQRLAKCRSSVEASTEAIRELREHNADLNKQVTRLQREVKDAVKDADESQRLLDNCEQRQGRPILQR